MRKKTKNDFLNLLRDFQKNTLSNKPPSNKIFEEIRMMSFKIRPLQGDISLINLNDKQLLEILWSLGKLDEFFQKEVKHMTNKEKEIFFAYFDDMQRQFQDKLNRLNLRMEKITSYGSVLEMEIFKEKRLKKPN